MDDLQRLRYDALTRQLERMRAMQYAYHRKFFTLLLVTTLSLGLILAVPTGVTLVFLAFGLVSTAVSACFLLHFADFARTHARFLEAQINGLLGERVLVGAELEADYFYRTNLPRPGRLSLEGPETFFSFYTLHFCTVWAGAILFAGYRLAKGLESGTFLLVLLAFTVWSALNGAFLYRWFRGGALRRMEAQLHAAYDQDQPPATG
ncbi:MAG: hypothetical protein J0L84_05035 [Verrucomicrobia bacterium]|nr:hypothetical protein [Verrucomicrobiota bacterium]